LHFITIEVIIEHRHNLGLWLKVDARAGGEATPRGGDPLRYTASSGDDQVS